MKVLNNLIFLWDFYYGCLLGAVVVFSREWQHWSYMICRTMKVEFAFPLPITLLSQGDNSLSKVWQRREYCGNMVYIYFDNLFSFSLSLIPYRSPSLSPTLPFLPPSHPTFLYHLPHYLYLIPPTSQHTLNPWFPSASCVAGNALGREIVLAAGYVLTSRNFSMDFLLSWSEQERIEFNIVWEDMSRVGPDGYGISRSSVGLSLSSLLLFLGLG